MSQRSVERALGKLVTDGRFRSAFLRDPVLASLRAGLDLSRDELDALRRVPGRALVELEARLDGRICRAGVDGAPERPE